MGNLRWTAVWLAPILGTLAFLLVLFSTGCKATAKEADPVGTYALVSVADKPLPCTIAHEGSPLVKSGTFIINADGTCSSEITFSAEGNEMTREVKATYTREGNKLTMTWEGAGMTVGTVERTSFKMENEGIIFAYRK